MRWASSSASADTWTTISHGSLVADPNGSIPGRLKDFRITGPCDFTTGQPSAEGQAFLAKLLKFDLQSMDWLFAPGGVMALKAARESGLVSAAKVHPMDCYTIPGIVKELGAMVHQLLTAMGAAKKSTNTMLTFDDWIELYLQHLGATSKLRDGRAKLAHLWTSVMGSLRSV